MKNDFTKTNLFSCPIYKIRIDPNSYDKEKIINDILYNKSLNNIRNDPHQNIGNPSKIHHCYEDFENENFRLIDYEKLSVVYSEIFEEFLNNEIFTIKEFKWLFMILNYAAVTEGQWLPAHNHLGNDECGDGFACIHYLNFKKDHILTDFHNPVKFAPFIKLIQSELNDILDRKILDNSYFFEQYRLEVEEDDMLIFPAALDHEIAEQPPTKEPRITISTNITILEHK